MEVEGALADSRPIRDVAYAKIVVSDREKKIDRSVYQPLMSATALITRTLCRASQYLPYSFVNSIIALRFSGFAWCVELLGLRM
jgi:hypothetical protein